MVASNHLETELVTQVVWIAYAKKLGPKSKNNILWAYCWACVMFLLISSVQKRPRKAEGIASARAASIKGEVVSSNYLKKSVIIAIQTIKKVLKRSTIIDL